MSNTRLIIKTAELTPEGFLIRSMEVIDGSIGKTERIAKLTPELLEFLKMTEIDVSNFLRIQEMKKKNPELKNLIDTFKLYT